MRVDLSIVIKPDDHVLHYEPLSSRSTNGLTIIMTREQAVALWVAVGKQLRDSKSAKEEL